MLERFLRELAEGIIFAGGTALYNEENALALAGEVWGKLKASSLGDLDAYPCMAEVAQDEMRFVYQWDEEPRLITVMVWDEVMWRDMARVQVPAEVAG